jgi:predicted RNA-binding Zn ribbon-like protein
VTRWSRGRRPARGRRRIDGWLVHAAAAGARARTTASRLGERRRADSPRRALGDIALDAARMLGTPAERARVRICASRRCGTRFYDRSPARAGAGAR